MEETNHRFNICENCKCFYDMYMVPTETNGNHSNLCPICLKKIFKPTEELLDKADELGFSAVYIPSCYIRRDISLTELYSDEIARGQIIDEYHIDISRAKQIDYRTKEDPFVKLGIDGKILESCEVVLMIKPKAV